MLFSINIDLIDAFQVTSQNKYIFRKRSRTSIKVRDRKRQQALTGNKPISQEPVTELERRVIAIIGSDYIEGHESVIENG